MTVKINNTICPVRHDEPSSLYYVDLDGQVTSGTTTDDLIEKLKSKYESVAIYSTDAV